MAKGTSKVKSSAKKGSRSSDGKSTGGKRLIRKIDPETKYKTGKSKDYIGKCKQEKVAECVDQGKFCNVDSGKCIQPKGASTKAKDKTMAIAPDYGIVGKATAVANIKKYLEKLGDDERKKLDVGVSTVIKKKTSATKKTSGKKRSVPTKKTSAKKKSAPTRKTSAKKKSAPTRKTSAKKKSVPTRKTSAKKKSAPTRKTSAKKKSAPTSAKKKSSDADCNAVGKLYNKATGNCIKDTAANRKKLGLPPVILRVKEMEKKLTKAAPVPGAPNYSKMTVKQLQEELRKRKLPVSGLKAKLIERLTTDDVKIPTPTPTPSPGLETPSESGLGCSDTGCPDSQVCNMETEKCIDPAGLKSKDVKNLWMLKLDDNVYYGSKAALSKFTKELDIPSSELKPASKERLIEASIPEPIETGAVFESPELATPSPIVPAPKREPVPVFETEIKGGKEEEEEDIDFEEMLGVGKGEELDIAGIVVSGEVTPKGDEGEEEEGLFLADILAKSDEPGEIVHEISKEEPLTKSQKELVDKIRVCLGI